MFFFISFFVFVIDCCKSQHFLRKRAQLSSRSIQTSFSRRSWSCMFSLPSSQLLQFIHFSILIIVIVIMSSQILLQEIFIFFLITPLVSLKTATTNKKEVDAQIRFLVQRREVDRVARLELAFELGHDARIHFRRRHGADHGRCVRRRAHCPRLDRLFALQLENPSSLASLQTPPVPALDLDSRAAPQSEHAIAFSPDPTSDRALDFHHRSVFWDPELDAESLDSANAAQEVQSARDIVEEHRVAFCPAVLLRI